MKKLIVLTVLTLTNLNVFSQNTLYGIVRKNYFSIFKNPIDTNEVYEQFDSATIRMGSLNPNTGLVSNIGNVAYNQSVNLTGAALNPYDSTFIFVGQTNINTMKLSNGLIINSVPVFNPISSSYFDNFRFNNADSTMYGLARRNRIDPNTNEVLGEVYMAKINTNNGTITQISPSSVGYGFALLGSSIDPYQMVYYYSDGINIIGLDIYTGLVYSKVPIINSFGSLFGNFTYNCNDNNIYGLIGKNYFRTITDSMGTYEVLDSNTQTLGKINPNTGVVSQISTNTLSKSGYTLNGGAAIDPNTQTYYFNIGTKVIGVNIDNGTIVSDPNFNFTDGQYFDLIRNFKSCYSASSLRKKPTSIKNEIANELSINIYPNPFTNKLVVNGLRTINKVEITTLSGNLIFEKYLNNTGSEIDLNELNIGMYLIKITSNDGLTTIKKIIKTN